VRKCEKKAQFNEATPRKCTVLQIGCHCNTNVLTTKNHIEIKSGISKRIKSYVTSKYF